MIRSFTVVAVTLACSLASADPPQPRDEEVAINLSLLGTLGSIILVGAAGSHTTAGWEPASLELAGAILAPSLGHAYAGDWLSVGLGVRTVGAGVAILGAIELARPVANSSSPSVAPVSSLGAGLALGGVGLMAAGAIYDIATTRHAVQQRNRDQLRVAPTAIAGSRYVSPGVGLVGMF